MSSHNYTSDNLKLLAQILSIDNHTSIKVGFAEIYKVDNNTFTIKSVDHDKFMEFINIDGVSDELTIKTNKEES